MAELLMRRALMTVVVAALFATPATAQPIIAKHSDNGLCHGDKRFYSLGEHKALTERAFDDAKLNERHKVKHKVMRDCHRGGAKTPAKMQRQWDKAREAWKDRYTYDRVWAGFSSADQAWARSTGECESGNDPDTNTGNGFYGAFQFMLSTWASSPKSPGGNPVDYDWTTQAVVAVLLKQRDGAGHWPNCG